MISEREYERDYIENARSPGSNIAFEHRLSTSSSLPMRTRHLNPVMPVTSASKTLPSLSDPCLESNGFIETTLLLCSHDTYQ